jgi:predicted methyltransferase
MKKIVLALAAFGALVAATPALKLDNSNRPAADVERDAARKSAAMV